MNEIHINSDGRRYFDRGGRKAFLCKGAGDGIECFSEARAGNNGMCCGCKSGRSKKEQDEIKIGEIKLCKDGIRRGRSLDGQLRHMCQGDNDTCKSYRKDGNGLCDGHLNETKKCSTVDLVKGEIVVRNGEQKVFDGIQVRIFCKYPECDQITVNDGYCKKHSPHWHCRFTGYQCTSIRINSTNYCTIHQDNIDRPKIKSIGEKRIAEYLTKIGIKFDANKYVKYDDHILYPDFYLPDFNTVIEFDGAGHFKSIDLWGGDEGLKKRMMDDQFKDNWVRQKLWAMLRISYLDMDRTEEILSAFISEINYIEAPHNISSSPSHTGKGYMIMDWI